ncbi:MAG: DNA polymerase III subunit gamma/tau, partial [Clostridia bacterium]
MTQALYRKYRPTTFDQVIGQSHITTALKNQIINNNLSHAYIFNGTRGVGKTSIARIFARAINCQNNTNGNPCLECSSCLDYEKGGNIDIIEIDAASNNSVGFARELTERVGYVANNGKYKVYIIDEAHMITQQAFNALLKTLEEPPEHVIFILCTTEVQAFPATILSRCMRFDFRLVSAGEISTLLSGIFDDLSIKYTNQAVKAIATAGEGSVRDALTIADRCVAVCQDLDYQDVMDILGATNRDILISLSQQIIAGDVSGLLQTITSLSNLGKSMTMLTKDLCRHFRDLLIISTVSNSFDMLGLPQDLFDKLVSQTATTNSKKLMQAVETFAKLEYTLRTSLSPQILFEAVSARLATNSLSDDLDGLEIRVAQLEKKLSLLSVDFKELNKAIEFSQQTQSQQ